MLDQLSRTQPLFGKKGMEKLYQARIMRRQVPESNAFVPSVGGLIIAGEVAKDLSGFGGTP